MDPVPVLTKSFNQCTGTAEEKFNIPTSCRAVTKIAMKNHFHLLCRVRVSLLIVLTLHVARVTSSSLSCHVLVCRCLTWVGTTKPWSSRCMFFWSPIGIIYDVATAKRMCTNTGHIQFHNSPTKRRIATMKDHNIFSVHLLYSPRQNSPPNIKSMFPRFFPWRTFHGEYQMIPKSLSSINSE